jgi:nicotinamide riboside kinase
MKIALLGAESTGKPTLALQLAAQLRQSGEPVAVVAEYLREFCERHARTPTQAEQAHIASEQSTRITRAAQQHPVVVADTTALMTAIYSELLFADTSLYSSALQELQHFEHVLVMALDLPWQADGLQRDGPHVQAPVQALLRAALQRQGIAYAVIGGLGERRLAQALAAVRHTPSAPGVAAPRWQWHCERCSDSACERHSRGWLPRG